MDNVRVTIWNSQDRIIYNGNIYSLPIPDSVISEKAMEYYFTVKLCCIRRSALKNRLLSELEQAMSTAGGRLSRIMWSSLPEEIKKCFSIDNDIKWCMLY